MFMNTNGISKGHCGGVLTSSSLCRVLDVSADVMPAFLEF